MPRFRPLALPFSLLALGFGLRGAGAPAPAYDVIVRGGTVYDGSGRSPYVADVGIRGDRIAAVGDLKGTTAASEVDARGLAVAPGFINMLSQSYESLMQDGRSESEIREGVTLEVMGEGKSMGPLNAEMKATMARLQGDIRFPVTWTTLGEFMETLEKHGVSCNIASFVGASTVRIHELGYADRAPTGAELGRMQALVREAMEEGAVGLSSALIYSPGFFARTDELIALARASAPYGGLYISHIRSEGDQLLPAIDELITIAREARVSAEVHHLKAAGRANWPKMDEAIRKIDAARGTGLDVSANMYTYAAASTGLNATMPKWVQEGGYEAFAARLRDPAIRARVKREMDAPSDQWENYFVAVGSPDKIIAVGFKNPAFKKYTGKTIADIARLRGTLPEDTIMDLIAEDGSGVEAIYFLMSEENVKRQLAIPWVAFSSDAPSQAPEGVFLKTSVHPRAYGSFARMLGHYVRDEKIAPLEDAIRRMTLLPARTLKIRDRGALRPGYFADVVIFDPAKIEDHATYDDPQVYATGVADVFVNGVQVLRNGEHTGTKPGRFVRGPGWKSPPGVTAAMQNVQAEGPPAASRGPIVRAVDLDTGETQNVELADRTVVSVRLAKVSVERDSMRGAVRSAKVDVEINGVPVTLDCGNYHRPVSVAGVRIDCTVLKEYYSNTNRDQWGLDKEARLRLWPGGSPLMEPGSFGYPLRQKWFATGTQMANEPTYMDSNEDPGARKVYYHNALDIGGCEGLTEAISATDGLVVAAADMTLPGYGQTPAVPRYDTVWILDERGWYYSYIHLQSIDPAIRPGARVKRGQTVGILGKEGSSGGWSHLHFCVTRRQPSGKWGTEEAYAYLWEAYMNEFKPQILAVARPHHFVKVGEKLVLDAGKSWSMAGDIVDYAWAFCDGTHAQGATVERVYGQPGEYCELLKATDSRGNSAYDFATVLVVDPAQPKPLPPTIHASYWPTRGIPPGGQVTFKVRTFGTTQGRERWDFGDGSPAVTVKSDGAVDELAWNGYAATTHRFATAGSYIVRVEREDERGRKAIAGLVVDIGN